MKLIVFINPEKFKNLILETDDTEDLLYDTIKDMESSCYIKVNDDWTYEMHSNNEVPLSNALSPMLILDDYFEDMESVKKYIGQERFIILKHTRTSDTSLESLSNLKECENIISQKEEVKFKDKHSLYYQIANKLNFSKNDSDKSNKIVEEFTTAKTSTEFIEEIEKKYNQNYNLNKRLSFLHDIYNGKAINDAFLKELELTPEESLGYGTYEKSEENIKDLIELRDCLLENVLNE